MKLQGIIYDEGCVSGTIINIENRTTNCSNLIQPQMYSIIVLMSQNVHYNYYLNWCGLRIG
jgi:hypothetical protein